MFENRLLLIDTTQTQRYIFGSNRLMENIGGSYLVAMATEQWVLQAVYEHIDKHNVCLKDDSQYDIVEELSFEDDKLTIEVIAAGGGNALLLGRTQKAIEDVLRPYSRRLLEEAPNIPVYSAERPFDWHNNPYGLRDAVGELMGKIADEAKRLRPQSQPLLGVGVTVPCRTTGLPAIQMSKAVSDDDIPYPISAEVVAKHAAADRDRDNNLQSAADDYLRRELPIDEQYYRYPSDFDDMVPRKGEANYIAIVHADGDGVGNRLKHLGENENWKNSDYIKQRRVFSNGLKQATRTALRATLNSVFQKLYADSGAQRNRLVWFYGNEERQVDLKATTSDGDQHYLPFRPIISGGDDITFVCDGRIGLALAINYARAFKEATAAILKQPISASVGVSIVRTHYPFARAYGLAEELMENAKETRRLKGWKTEEIGVIDWHFTVGGLYGDVETIRKREYQRGSRHLTLRPVAIETPTTSSERSWETVRKGIDAFQEATKGEEERQWSTRRNKLKALRDALREGKEAVEQFRTMFLENEKLPDVGHPDFQRDGHYGSRCGYFDALELSDWFMPVPAAAINVDEVQND